MLKDIVVLKHCELNDSDLKNIIELKQQHWNYDYESQLAWINRSFNKDDLHILLFELNKAVAYLSVSQIECILDDKECIVLGIGSVCVDKEMMGKGYGKKIVEAANELINNSNKIGFLLCHKNLVDFYKQCGWTKLDYDEVEIDQKVFSEIVMTMNNELNHIHLLLLNKSF